MAQWTEALVSKIENLSSIPETHSVDREKQLLKVVLVFQTRMHTHMQ